MSRFIRKNNTYKIKHDLYKRGFIIWKKDDSLTKEAASIKVFQYSQCLTTNKFVENMARLRWLCQQVLLLVLRIILNRNSFKLVMRTHAWQKASKIPSQLERHWWERNKTLLPVGKIFDVPHRNPGRWQLISEYFNILKIMELCQQIVHTTERFFFY